MNASQADVPEEGDNDLGGKDPKQRKVSQKGLLLALVTTGKGCWEVMGQFCWPHTRAWGLTELLRLAAHVSIRV